MTYTILIVEDEYLVRQGLTKLVNVAAYDMEIIGQAENGRQAWELIQKQVPDIILTGYQHASAKWHPVGQSGSGNLSSGSSSFLTGYDDFDYALSAVKLGVMTTCSSPFLVRILRGNVGENQAKLDKEEEGSSYKIY